MSSAHRGTPVVVIGSGNAGLVAAITAAEKGARVQLLEKASEVEMGGTTRYAPGVLRFAFDDVAAVFSLIPDLSDAERDGVHIETYPGRGVRGFSTPLTPTGFV